MAKKNRKKHISDKIQEKSKGVKMTNPFEVHFNRQKINVLGRRLKSESGLRGISRTQAIKKRKTTLLQEYKVKAKSNKFLDRRIGEKNSFMTSEDKLVARFTAERMKSFSKKNKFNLAEDDEEFLTHKGKTLTEIEKFDNPASDEDDEEETGDGKLGSSFVGEAHFGGGMLKKVDGESNSRKDLIEQMIAESKKRKAEKQKQKEEMSELTDQLDTDWKALMPFLVSAKRKKEDEFLSPEETRKAATYDKLNKELKFDSRGKPTDKLKSVEEEARIEKETLEKLEQERNKRMKNEDDVQGKTQKHRSADDLDDGIDLDEEDEVTLEYDTDGKPVAGLGTLGRHESELSKSDSVGDSDEAEEEVDDEESSNSESEIDISDLKDVDGEEAKEIADVEEENEEKQMDNVVKENKNKCKKDENYKSEKKKAESELPFTLNVPENYEGFEKLVFKLTPAYQSVAIERMIKCTHPSLHVDNKKKLSVLFTYVLQLLQDVAVDEETRIKTFDILDHLAPHLYDLTHTSPIETSLTLFDVIKEKKDNFTSGRRKCYPGLDTLLFFKLVSVLYPTSDFRHRVVTPTILFMTHLLSACRVHNSIDISRGLFITSLIVEFTSLSKRFSPEAVNFVRGVLRMGQPTSCDVKPVLPFKSDNLTSSLLHCPHYRSENKSSDKLTTKHLVKLTNCDKFKYKSLSLSLKLGQTMLEYWNSEPAAYLIFEPFLTLLDPEAYPEQLRTCVKQFHSSIISLQDNKLQKLVFVVKRPKPLKLLEPNIEEITDTKRRRPMSREKQEREKLLHKVKRETKGALRELRRDKAFIAKIQFREKMKSDLERKRKVQEILGSVAQETGEVRKFKRQKS